MNKDLIIEDDYPTIGGANTDKLTIDDLKNFETKYKINLPEDYKEFLLEHNGCMISSNFDNTLASKFIETDLGYFHSLDSIEILLDNSAMKEWHCDEILKRKMIPFVFDSSGRTEAYIGVGENNLGKIYLTDLEFVGGKYEEVFNLCESFTEFMDSYILREEE